MTSATHETRTAFAADLRPGDHLISRGVTVVRVVPTCCSDVLVFVDTTPRPLSFFADTTLAIARPRMGS